MKRTSKRYVITTSALNCYLFRILTEGIDYSQFEKNPILLWMHIRPRGLSKSEVLPLGRAVDIKREGDQLTCYLEFDETDAFAMQIFNKYENGTLNMVSPGINPIEWTEDPARMLPGQIGPTILKGKLFELSCVDIGGNDDALPIQLYDASDNMVKLADFSADGLITLFNSLQVINSDNEPMKVLTLSAETAGKILLGLKLEATASETQVAAAVQNLITLNSNLTNENAQLKTEKETVQGDLDKTKADLAKEVKLANDAKIEALVQGAVDAGKILAGQKSNYVTLAASNFETTKSALDAMPGSTTLAETLKVQQDSANDWHVKLSYDELDKKGLLGKLKTENVEAFKLKFRERWGKEYKG